MKIIDAINNVIRPESKDVWDFSANDDDINESLGIGTLIYYHPDELRARLKAYPIMQWHCTDQHVGLYALYFDDEAVGCYYKAARKSAAEVEWLSPEIAAKVREAILTYADKPAYTLLDPEQDIGDDFVRHYAGEPLTDDGTYEGRAVRALVWYDAFAFSTTDPKYRKEGKSYVQKVNMNDHRHKTVKVQFVDDGKKKNIPINEFRMAFSVNQP